MTTTEEVLQQLQPWREKWRRSAWKPLTEEGDGAVTTSKFAGMPWLAQGESWPLCQHCHAPMPLFLQLNLEQLPSPLAGTFGIGLLQLFYCTQCHVDGWEPFSKGSLVRIVDANGPAQQEVGQGATDSFPAKRIVEWEEFADYPHPAEQNALGLELLYDWESEPPTLGVKCPEFGILFEGLESNDLAERISEAVGGDKLAGWARWIQGVEYPTCPRCERQMSLLFQLDSEDHLPFMFGDLGTGHITQCPVHKEMVAFGWACY